MALDSTLRWLLKLLVLRNLRASLEVVPYLVDFDEVPLAIFDPAGDLFEVSQHGYAHVPRSGRDGKRYEFAPDADHATSEEDQVISLGKHRLQEFFPTRFRGGFSPPYDGLPNWLPAQWYKIGGTFVSSVFTKRVDGAPVPLIRAGTDIWNWSRDRSRLLREILQDINRQAREDGHAGIILHPRCLRTRRDRVHLVKLLDALQVRGIDSTTLSELATNQSNSKPGFANSLKALARRISYRR